MELLFVSTEKQTKKNYTQILFLPVKGKKILILYIDH